MHKDLLAWIWYPGLFAAAIAAFAAMQFAGWPLAAAVYIPISGVALSILLLERFAPARLDWRPRAQDVKADLAFIALVQVAVPRVLAPLAVMSIAYFTQDAQRGPWPHHWPLAAQAILMVLTVDFVRYWLHRACHTFTPLWRLHEVHHSPDLLYSLNVGRFHPLEKALHFCADSVPYLMLGVAPEVLGAYTLLYSVNGFFQHSNVRLRYGLLNYLVGSAETHRWHHARDPRTAHCNFGNTTILWDLLFGTWYLPRNRRLDVGIPDRTYPKGFWAQMSSPFHPAPGAGLRLRASLADLVIGMQLRLTGLWCGWRIARAMRDPMSSQLRLLRRILRENRGAAYGIEHRFATIRSLEDFRTAVPVNDYEALRPYVQAEIDSGEPGLTTAAPVRYLRTSGTTGMPKDVPLTAFHQKMLRRVHRMAVARQRRLFPSAFEGSVLVLTSPADEGFLANGRPFGSASGAIAGSTPRLVQDKFVVPQSVLAIEDSRVKYLLVLRLAIARTDITYLGSANASTLLQLMKLYRVHAAELIRDVREGGFFLAGEVPADTWAALRTRLSARPERADELLALERSGRTPRIADLWPRLRLVVTWTCASAGIAARVLRSELSEGTHVHELGYVASEFRGTFTLGRRAGSGIPTWDTHFFEFVERDRWDRGEPVFLTLGEIRKGVDYYVLVTTPSGLYRYFINDLVRVSGFIGRMPLIRFLQKGKGVTSITGEKLYEAQVLEAVARAMAGIGHCARFVMMLADEHAQRYRLYVEPDPAPRCQADELARAVDQALQALNIEYRAKRESGRLGPLEGRWLRPGADEAFKRHCVGQGQREGQFKVVALDYAAKFTFDIAPWVERERDVLELCA